MTSKVQKLLTMAFIVIAISFVAKNVNAQKNAFVFIHGNFLGPLDESSKNRFSSGIGGELGGAIGNGSTYFTGTLGYTNFSEKTTNGYAVGNLSYIPLKIGVRQNLPFLANLIYVHADGGIGFVNYQNSTPAVDSLSKSRLAFDIGTGVRLGSIDLGIVWDNFKEVKPGGWSSWLGVKVGWRFDVIGSSKK